MGQEPDIEIEIEDPEEVTIRSGDMEIEIDPDEEEDDEFNENLAETLDEGQLTQLAGDLIWVSLRKICRAARTGYRPTSMVLSCWV